MDILIQYFIWRWSTLNGFWDYSWLYTWMIHSGLTGHIACWGSNPFQLFTRQLSTWCTIAPGPYSVLYTIQNLLIFRISFEKSHTYCLPFPLYLWFWFSFVTSVSLFLSFILAILFTIYVSAFLFEFIFLGAVWTSCISAQVPLLILGHFVSFYFFH